MTELPLSAASLSDRIRAEGAPLIDGDQVTFVWLGQTAPYLVGDFNQWSHTAAIRLQAIADGIWAHTITLPRDAYVEYAWFTSPADADRHPDPFNPRRVWNGISTYNHVLVMPECVLTPLMTRTRTAPPPCLTRHNVSAFLYHWKPNTTRRVYLYHPPTDAPVPLLLVYDGPDYVLRARLVNIVHNLILARRIRPIALALVANGGGARLLEYMTSDVTLAWIERDVLPLATRELNLLDVGAQPGAFGVLGASMGGLMAFYTGLRLPHLFGNVIAQSGAFGFPMSRTLLIQDLVRYLPPPPLRIWLDVGSMEWLLQANREFRDLMTTRSYNFQYHEYNGGHNYTVWGNEVVAALEAMFG